MIEQHIRGIPKGMTLRSSDATSDEERKFSSIIRANIGKNPMTCHINATCNAYTMTNNFSNEKTLTLLEVLEKKYAQLEEEHLRTSRKYRVSKVLLKEFVDIMDAEDKDADKYTQVCRLHSKVGGLFISKRERDEALHEEGKKKAKHT